MKWYTHHHKQYTQPSVFSSMCCATTVQHRLRKKEVRLFNIDTISANKATFLYPTMYKNFRTHMKTQKKRSLNWSTINTHTHTQKYLSAWQSIGHVKKGWKTSEKEVNFVNRDFFFFLLFLSFFSYPSFDNSPFLVLHNRRRKNINKLKYLSIELKLEKRERLIESVFILPNTEHKTHNVI